MEVICTHCNHKARLPEDKIPDRAFAFTCPKCKGTIQPENGGSSLVCHSCKLRYRVEDDIPVMLIDEAEEI